MKITGTLWKPDAARKQGLKPTTSGGKVAHLSFSTGVKVAKRDNEGKIVIGKDGKPETEWDNTYYSTSSFNGLAEHLTGLLEALPAGQKGLALEISGEDTPKIHNGKIVHDFRIISARIPGEADWATTKEGKLVRRTIN